MPWFFGYSSLVNSDRWSNIDVTSSVRNLNATKHCAVGNEFFVQTTGQRFNGNHLAALYRPHASTAIARGTICCNLDAGRFGDFDERDARLSFCGSE
jgi:hypothetical protein